MAIKGTQKEQLEVKEKKVGFGEFDVVLVNPTREEFKTILGMDLSEESKADQYLGESKENNTTLRLDFWGQNTKTKEFQKATFFLEDKYKESKVDEENTDKVKKYQFINNVGTATWVEDENDLKDWFKKYGYRKARVGEEELYSFVKNWLGKIDQFKADADLSFEWKPLMKGNIKEIKAQVKGEWSVPFLWLLTVKTVVKEGEETKQYQNVYNRNFLPSYTLAYFSQKDYTSETVLSDLRAKVEALKGIKSSGGIVNKSDKIKNFEYFALQVTDSQFGCKDSFCLKPLKKFVPEDYLVSSEETILHEENTDLPF